MQKTPRHPPRQQENPNKFSARPQIFRTREAIILKSAETRAKPNTEVHVTHWLTLACPRHEDQP
jgi:hypothetical protein